MDIHRHINHTKSLVSIISLKVESALAEQTDVSIKSGVIHPRTYISSLHEIIRDFDEEITGFELDQLQKLSKHHSPEEMNELITLYLNLLDYLFYSLLTREGGIRIELVSQILTAFKDVVRVVNLYFTKPSMSIPISKTLGHAIIEFRVELEKEIHLWIAHDVQLAVNRRIDAELDKIRSDNNNELNALSSQYSLGRESLLESTEKYKTSINEMMSGASSRLDEYEQKIAQALAKIEERETEINNASKSAENYLEMAGKVLERNSQSGMATAFQNRHNKLFWPMVIWAGLFFVCLAVLVIINGTKLIDIMQINGIGFVNGHENNLHQFLLKISISLPLIWGAWFSAKQYTHLSRLREDYAYKVAIAMTYHGYKDEANSIDGKMGEKLLDTIVTQFSDNPVRLYQNNNHASIVEAMIKNDKVSDLMNAAQKFKQ